MKQVPQIHNFLYGLAAVLLAFFAQRCLQNNAVLGAVALYIGALVLFLVAFHRPVLASTAAFQDALVLHKSSARTWWQPLLLLPAAILAILALRQFHVDIELPTL